MSNPRIEEKPFTVRVDGLLLSGRWFAADQEGKKPCVLILHGIPRDKSGQHDESYSLLARRLAALGWISIWFNFRGAGESEGDFHILGWARDLAGVVGFALEQMKADPLRLAVIGFSGGAATAIYTAAQDERIRAVAALSSPAEFSFGKFKVKEWLKRFREIGLIRNSNFPADENAWENEFKEISPRKWIDRISPRPVLIIHGRQDEVVPVEHASILFEKANNPKQLVIVEAGHRLKHSPEAVAGAVSWLEAWKNNKIK